jgi:hypothetical protein
VVNVLLAKMSSPVAGTVTAAGSGSPVADACVTLTDAQGMVVDARYTGPDGGYAFSGLHSARKAEDGQSQGWHDPAAAVDILAST